MLTPPLAAPSGFEYAPARGMQSPITQSILATKRPAGWMWSRRGTDIESLSEDRCFAVADEDRVPVQLTARYTPHPAPRGLALVIHGWEGSHKSGYVVSMASYLWRAGFAVVRLNLRDHAGTHHLNEGLFHSARMQEVLLAAKAAQDLLPQLPMVSIGFSLGGNFALRIGLYGHRVGLRPALCVGISPSVNPARTIDGIDSGPKLFHRYFLRKWRKTLRAKAAAWPQKPLDFAWQLRQTRFRHITERFVAEHTHYPSLDDYFAQYTLTPDLLNASPTPLAILTAADDSVCPPEDFEGLEQGPHRYLRTAHGGHCGFISNWRMDCFAEALTLRWIEERLAS